MPISGYKLNIEPLKLLSEEQVHQVHKATITVLKETGIKTDNQMALKLFKKHDCIVDFDMSIAKIPEDLIKECLKTVPKNF